MSDKRVLAISAIGTGCRYMEVKKWKK